MFRGSARKFYWLVQIYRNRTIRYSAIKLSVWQTVVKRNEFVALEIPDIDRFEKRFGNHLGDSPDGFFSVRVERSFISRLIYNEVWPSRNLPLFNLLYLICLKSDRGRGIEWAGEDESTGNVRKNENGIFIMMYYISQARRDARRTFFNEPREWIVRDIEIGSEFICCSGPIYSSTSVIRELSSLERRKSRRQRTVRASINISSSYVLFIILSCLSWFFDH